MRSWIVTLHALFWSSDWRKCMGIIFNCLVDPNISNSTSYRRSNLGRIFLKFVSKIRTTWKLWISVRVFYILKSYILRHHLQSLTQSSLRCVRHHCRFVPGYEPWSPSPSFCSISSNIFVFHSQKNDFVSAHSGVGFAYPDTARCTLSKTPLEDRILM